MTDDFYPIPENAETTKFILGRARRARDEHGRMLLDRLLDKTEREIVQLRLHELAASLKEAKRADVARELLAIFPDVEVDVAKARAKALAEGMDGLPMFAIKRAALQMSQRGVTAPERVALRTEAENVARPYWNEASIGSLLLHARKNPNAQPSEAERARISAGFDDLLATLREREEESPWGKKARKRRTRMANADSRMRRIRDYEEAGLAPMFADKAGKIVVSLALLERLGWRVEQVGHETVLVRPEWLRGKTKGNYIHDDEQ